MSLVSLNKEEEPVNPNVSRAREVIVGLSTEWPLINGLEVGSDRACTLNSWVGLELPYNRPDPTHLSSILRYKWILFLSYS